MNQAFEDWVNEARSVSVMDAAIAAGVVFKRGQKAGPCPSCGGDDRFSVNPGKNAWNCRGAKGGYDGIGLVMHVLECDFIAACVILARRPAPNGREGRQDPVAAEKARQRREQNEAAAAKRRRDDERKASFKRNSARDYWRERWRVGGSVAEVYARSRCVSQIDQIPALGYHPSVYNENVKKNHRALLGCVTGPDQKFRGIWRIFLNQDGMKAPVPYVKKGLGKPEGGAVWVADREQMKESVWGICEGIETALAIRELDKLPVFASLSTSGMIGFQVPEFVTHLQIYADGDLPYRNKDGVWQIPPGMNAAQKLAARLTEFNLSHNIVEPPQDGDWNDVLVNAKEAGLV